jgi:hypothetical protein
VGLSKLGGMTRKGVREKVHGVGQRLKTLATLSQRGTRESLNTEQQIASCVAMTKTFGNLTARYEAVPPPEGLSAFKETYTFFFLWKKKNQKKPQSNDVRPV